MAARAQHTRVTVGRTSAGVGLVKMSTTPNIGAHEVRKVTVGNDKSKPPNPEADPTAVEPGDPMGSEDSFVGKSEPAPPPSQYASPVPEVRTEWGVTNNAGQWIDLTDRLKAIDEDNKIEGMNIEATVPLTHLPRTWTREAYYVNPSDPASARFLSMIWCGLVPTGSAAIVRWTKKTDQYVGAIIARGTETKNPHLVLIELEWPENLRPVEPTSVLPVDVIGTGSRDKAAGAMRALRKQMTYMDDLHNTRLAQREELLQAARDGRKLPKVEVAKDYEVYDELERLVAAA